MGREGRPVRPDLADETRDIRYGRARGAASERVLVVEPDADAAFTLAAWLERRGYAVTVAPTAAAATHCISALSVDLALVSEALPDMSLPEIAHRLRARSYRRDLRIVGTAREPIAYEAIDTTLRRPITPEALDALLGDPV